MTFDFLAMRTTSTAEKRAEKERLKEEERAKAQAIEQVCVDCFFHLFSPVYNSVPAWEVADSRVVPLIHSLNAK